MLQELTIALRTLIKRPGYALSVILTLTIGIGASTMMFSLLDAAMLRPLPFAQPERLVMLTGVFGPERIPRGGSFPEVGDWRTMNQTLVDVSRVDSTSLNLRIGTEAVRVRSEIVSPGYFPLLGATAALGLYVPARGRCGARPRRRGDHQRLAVARSVRARSGILQRTISLNDRPFVVVGVMPDGFAGLSFDADVWVPSMMVSLTNSPGVVQDRGSRWLGALGRLKDGVYDGARSGRSGPRGRHPRAAVPGQPPAGGRAAGDRPPVAARRHRAAHGCALYGGGAVPDRRVRERRESSARAGDVPASRARRAAGAWRAPRARAAAAADRVVRAVARSGAARRDRRGLEPQRRDRPDAAGALPRHVQPSVDPRALAFTIVVSVVAGALVALVPGFASLRSDLTGAIKEGARSAGPGLGSIRRPSIQQGLVVAEIALAMTLLSAAGLMIRGLERQMRVPLGFDPKGLTVASLTLPTARYTPEQRGAFVERLSERLQALPRYARPRSARGAVHGWGERREAATRCGAERRRVAAVRPPYRDAPVLRHDGRSGSRGTRLH